MQRQMRSKGKPGSLLRTAQKINDGVGEDSPNARLQERSCANVWRSGGAARSCLRPCVSRAAGRASCPAVGQEAPGGSLGAGIKAGDGLGTHMLLVQVALPPTF